MLSAKSPPCVVATNLSDKLVSCIVYYLGVRSATMNSSAAIDSKGFDVLAEASSAVASRLGDAVVEKISRAILEGRLKPGDALPSEARIAEAFGVSKAVAREAVRDLAANGMVLVQQGKVSRVRAPDAEPLDRFFRFAVRGSANGLSQAIELRRILEPAAARLAAMRRTAADVAGLRAILAEMGRALSDVPAWIEADIRFHEAIAAATGNRLLAFQLRGLRPVNREVMERFNSRDHRGPAEWRETLRRHVVVVDAIESGDAARAEAAMRAHFEAADTAIRELFPSLSSETRAADEPARSHKNTNLGEFA